MRQARDRLFLPELVHGRARRARPDGIAASLDGAHMPRRFREHVPRFVQTRQFARFVHEYGQVFLQTFRRNHCLNADQNPAQQRSHVQRNASVARRRGRVAGVFGESDTEARRIPGRVRAPRRRKGDQRREYRNTFHGGTSRVMPKPRESRRRSGPEAKYPIYTNARGHGAYSPLRPTTRKKRR